MIRVLQISTCDYFRGVEKLELELFKNIDKSIKYDFLTPNSNTFKNYKEEINKLDGQVYDFNIKRNNIKNKLKYAFRLHKFLKQNKYDVIHINSSAFFFSLHVAIIAKLCKIKKIIVHSHSVRKINKIKKIFIHMFNPILFHISDVHLACSNDAAETFYNKKYLNKVTIINNGIDINNYKFNIHYRNKYRKQLNIENKIVYGHVGNFDERKNHSFLIDLFYEIQKINKDSILLLVGEGKLIEEIKDKVNKLHIEDKVIFLGFISSVNEILNTMDVFIFPSEYEGLGIAIIESQTNGLISYCSDNISDSANISPYFRKFNLNAPKEEIAKIICKEKINIENRKLAYKNTKINGYDIKDTCMKLKKVYFGK